MLLISNLNYFQNRYLQSCLSRQEKVEEEKKKATKVRWESFVTELFERYDVVGRDALSKLKKKVLVVDAVAVDEEFKRLWKSLKEMTKEDLEDFKGKSVLKYLQQTLLSDATKEDVEESRRALEGRPHNDGSAADGRTRAQASAMEPTTPAVSAAHARGGADAVKEPTNRCASL